MYQKELRNLCKSKVRYLVIGAVAMGLRNYIRATTDLDIMIDLNKKILGMFQKH